jgi:hypothetical protein
VGFQRGGGGARKTRPPRTRSVRVTRFFIRRAAEHILSSHLVAVSRSASRALTTGARAPSCPVKIFLSTSTATAWRPARRLTGGPECWASGRVVSAFWFECFDGGGPSAEPCRAGRRWTSGRGRRLFCAIVVTISSGFQLVSSHPVW